MRSAEYAGFAAALAGASCFLGIGAPPAKAGLSAHAHDGIYAIHIVTQHGSCHKADSTKIVVRGDQIHVWSYGAGG